MLSTEALLIHFLKIVVVSYGMESLSCPLYSVFRRKYIVKLRQFVFISIDLDGTALMGDTPDIS